jgi:alginate O-acetyltransferase complex protein AlgJ
MGQVSPQEHFPESKVERTIRLTPITGESHEAWLPVDHPLHRPRHGGRQLTAMFCAVVFFVVPVLAMALGVRAPEDENHRLAPFPSPRDGWEFFVGISEWGTDHLPFRDTAVHMADGISRGVFGEPAPFDQTQRVPLQVPQAPPEVDIAQTQLDEPSAAAGFPKVIEGKQGWLYLGFDIQGKCRPRQPLDDVIANLRRLRDAVQRSGRKFFLVVPPDKSTIVTEFLPDTYVGKSCAQAASEDFWRRATSEVGIVDLRTNLRRIGAAGGGQPYRQLDTHWDDRGALMMVRRLADRLEPDITSTWKVVPERVSRYRADLPKLLGRDGYGDIQLYSLSPDGQHNQTRIPIGDLHTPVQLQSPALDGMVSTPVGVLGDSFMLSTSRYLPAAFSDLDIVFYETLKSNPAAALDVITRNEVVVFEVVERNLASGTATLVQPAAVDLIVRHLDANPRR